ncbi:MAG: hypothetical protein RJA70_4027 [Pseudomonadota bacterium]|jgi:cysteine-rich repeat protein
MLVRLTPRLITLGALALASFALAGCSKDANNSSTPDDAADAGGTDAGGNGEMGVDDAGPDDKPDTDEPDAGNGQTPDAGAGADGGTPPDGGISKSECDGADDGAKCSDGICVAETCAPSRCGDGLVDPKLKEECDDENDVSGDGCNLCRFDCTKAADCDDNNSCNGPEACTDNTCVAGVAEPEATECDLDAVTKGACRAGQCASVGCGNSVVDAGEECDDGNTNNADGCTSRCAWTCASDANCGNGDACDGVETCQLADHTCKAGTPVECLANGCSGTCDPVDGMCVFPDVDADGASCDVDCADADPARFPGGFECKDGKDNDCDTATVDNSSTGCECYVDTDNDGFAADTKNAIASPGSCPSGYTRTIPGRTTSDCAPSSASAFPGQSEYFETSYCPFLLCNRRQRSFDYNCNGEAESFFTDGKLGPASCATIQNSISCGLASGWVADIPACGAAGTYRSCSWTGRACTGQDLADRVRPCN